MRIPSASSWFILGLLAGGLACGPALVARPGPGDRPPAERSPLGMPRSLRSADSVAPLVLDRTDLRIGTTVQFMRIPDAQELEDLRFVRGFQRLVLALDRWPEDPAALTGLSRLPAEIELLVVLPGYPPSHAAAAVWNQLPVPARLVVVASGPPDPGIVDDLNLMRALERVVVDTDTPSRAGFERLQRPVAFRVVRE